VGAEVATPKISLAHKAFIPQVCLPKPCRASKDVLDGQWRVYFEGFELMNAFLVWQIERGVVFQAINQDNRQMNFTY
jgi:hypothetical protein